MLKEVEKAVQETLQLIGPYLRLKQPHYQLALEIFRALPKRFTPEQLITVGKLVDQYKELNYSKKRTNTVETLKSFFADQTNHDSP